ncbi:MAG: MFS transporter [Betaproteobacteria bacterium]|nr:MAG: MFS transporter [Betaproteobacteria bacterium]
MTDGKRGLLAAVVCGGLVMGLALGARHVQGLFLVPMTAERGWTREAFAFAIAVQNLVWGFAQPLTGMIADRYGSLRVILAGTLLYAAGLAAMAAATTPAGLTLSAGVLVGVALSCTSFGAVYGALSRLAAPAQRPWALGLAGAVGGFGQFAMVPAAHGLIGMLGWAAALVALGVAIALAGPAAFTLRDRPSDAASGPAQSMRAAIREAFAHRGFRLLNLGFLACGFQLAFIASHLPAYLLDRGLSAADGVAALAIVALANVAGTYCCGRLGGVYRRKRLLAALYLVRAGAMAAFVLLPATPWSVWLFAAVMGFLWLGTVPLTNGLVAQVFGVRYITTLFGFVFLGHQVGSFLGVWLGGLVFDATGSYDAIWAAAIALGVIAAALHWPIDDREIVRSAHAAGAA